MKTRLIGLFESLELANKKIESLEAQRLEGDNTTYFIEVIEKYGVSYTDYAVKAKINFSPELQKELDELFN